ncbi:hypothetical protein DEO72_LG6g1670 [Vigna unguiculata]|uniref:TF-B3 domain-containing protein n=1 Tax=Vigna unguiculata TaxID=3917 RepID=A0A4D6M8E5_VIGUN|nr:hypothetical protein DEO72_LG6g1670 [Vigna unguiculata]
MINVCFQGFQLHQFLPKLCHGDGTLRGSLWFYVLQEFLEFEEGFYEQWGKSLLLGTNFFNDPKGNVINIEFEQTLLPQRQFRAVEQLMWFYELNDVYYVYSLYCGDRYFRIRIFSVEGVEIDYKRDFDHGGSNKVEVGAVDCEKILSPYDVRSSSLYRDAKFVKEGLVKGRKNYVLTNSHSQYWNCKIRWTGRSSFECYLTCGWKKYCKEKGLVVGDRVRFMVQTDQSNVIQILKI